MKPFAFFNNLRVGYKLILMFVLFGFIPNIGIGIYFFSNGIGAIQEKSFEYSFEQLERTNQDLQLFFERYSYILSSKLNSADFRSRLLWSEQFSGYAGKATIDQMVYDELQDIVSRERVIDSIYLYLDSGDKYLVNLKGSQDEEYQLEGETWFPQAISHEENYFLLGPHIDNQLATKSRSVISIVIKVRLPTYGKLGAQDQPQQAYLVCNFLTYQIIDTFFHRPYRERIILSDYAGDIVFATDARLLVDNTSEVLNANIARKATGASVDNLNGKNYLVAWDETTIPDVKAILVTQNESVVNDIRRLSSLGGWLVLIASMFYLAMLLLSSNNITTPIKKLEESIRHVEAGDFSRKISVSSSDEIGALSKHYNTMLDRIESLILEVEQNCRTKQELELLILQSQINPHFLFNTLNSIRFITQIQGNETATHALRSLILLLQSSIRFGQDFISIRDEVEQINNYIDIQKIRYIDRFEVDYAIDPDVLDCKTLKFTLQPIVENAIFHGIETIESMGKISVSIRRAEDEIVYTVSDNGMGFDQQKLVSILEDLDSNYRTRGFNQIGLKNVQDRIHLFFGEAYGLRIDSEPGCGTIVTIRIPAIPISDEEESK